jgi:competence protein ComEA
VLFERDAPDSEPRSEAELPDGRSDDSSLLAFRTAMAEVNGAPRKTPPFAGQADRSASLAGLTAAVVAAARERPRLMAGLVLAPLAVLAAVIVAGPVVGAGPPTDPDLPMATARREAAGTAPSSSSAETQAPVPHASGVPGPAMVVVHVTGAVHAPGVWEVASGSRIRDLLAVAGGSRPDADLERINLAAVVADGTRVYVPVLGEVAAPPLVTADGLSPSTGAGPGPAGTGSGGMVALNSATAAELETLPGVGAATAAAIIEHRTARGPFLSVEGLLEVRGIGSAKLAGMRDRLVL